MADDKTLQEVMALLAKPGAIDEYKALKADAINANNAAKMAKIEASVLLDAANAKAAENDAKAAQLAKALDDAQSAKGAAEDAAGAANAATAAANAAAKDFAARSNAVEVERSKLAVAIGDAHNAEAKAKAAIESLKSTIAALDI